jgi:hypothetical protein
MRIVPSVISSIVSGEKDGTPERDFQLAMTKLLCRFLCELVVIQEYEAGAVRGEGVRSKKSAYPVPVPFLGRYR